MFDFNCLTGINNKVNCICSHEQNGPNRRKEDGIYALLLLFLCLFSIDFSFQLFFIE
ncbi:hypothetical protein DsansV1_C14g0128451 [Dioscorea sansibarensis]